MTFDEAVRSTASPHPPLLTTSDRPESYTRLHAALPYSDKVEDYVTQLLQQASHAAERRDALLEEVKAQVEEDSLVQPDVDSLRRFGVDVVTHLVQQTAALARVVRTNAAFAARASVRAKQLHRILERAQAVRAVVQSMQVMSSHVQDIPLALAQDDLTRAVSLIRAYTEAQRMVKGGNSVDDATACTDEEDEDEQIDTIATTTTTNSSAMKDSVDHALAHRVAMEDKGKQKKERELVSADSPTPAKTTEGDVVAQARAEVYARLIRVADALSIEAQKQDPTHATETEAARSESDTHIRALQPRRTSHSTNDAHESGREDTFARYDKDDDDAAASAEAPTAASGPSTTSSRMRHVCTLLCQLGFVPAARERYVHLVRHRVTAALQRAVAEELRKMADPQSAAMSHLALVSHILDTVVAAFELETAFVQEQFGATGVLALLRELHDCATASAVPVMRNFVTSRQDMLQSMSPVTSIQRGGEMNDVNRSMSEDAATRRVAQARHVDRTLEDMSHLVSCCSVYLNFLAKKERDYRGHDTKIASSTNAANEHTRMEGELHIKHGDNCSRNDMNIDDLVMNYHGTLGRDKGNGLMDAVQELLAMYVPLQREYFDMAFAQAVMLQETTIAQMDATYAQHCARRARTQHAGTDKEDVHEQHSDEDMNDGYLASNNEGNNNNSGNSAAAAVQGRVVSGAAHARGASHRRTRSGLSHVSGEESTATGALSGTARLAAPPPHPPRRR